MAPKSVPKTCNTSKRIANWIASSEFNLERPPLARTWNKRFRGSRPSQSAAKDGAPHALIVLTKIKGWATRPMGRSHSLAKTRTLIGCSTTFVFVNMIRGKADGFLRILLDLQRLILRTLNRGIGTLMHSTTRSPISTHRDWTIVRSGTM
jgi:hypothetical protein